ncbi:MAG: D-glycerate dehydrogenase [Deinococcus sp.]|nr:D-glycerate dehydrogenase [Deinococcus sp.]
MTRIVVLDDYPPALATSQAYRRLRELGEVTLFDTLPQGEAAVIDRLRDSDVAINIRSSTKITNVALAAVAGELRLVSIWGTGTDNVDLQAARQWEIRVTNTPNTATEAVAEHGLALLLALARRVVAVHNALCQGRWSQPEFFSQLYGKTLGIVGTGAIGRQMARLGVGLGMAVIAWSPHPKPELEKEIGLHYLDSLEEILRQADVVSLHLRLTEEYQGMIGEKELRTMKPTALLLNTARGGLIDQKALVTALEQGWIAGTALDVFATEPISPQDPLLTLPNVVLSPHCAGRTREAVENGLLQVVDNVRAFLQNQPQHVVV